MITLKEFLSMFGGPDCGLSEYVDGEPQYNAFGNCCISIPGLCEELSHEDVYRSRWFHLHSDRQVESFQIIGGGSYPVELVIHLFGIGD